MVLLARPAEDQARFRRMTRKVITRTRFLAGSQKMPLLLAESGELALQSIGNEFQQLLRFAASVELVFRRARRSYNIKLRDLH